MNDRELLELAAFAVGMKYQWEQEGYIYGDFGVVPEGWRRCWNPITNNSDAFELMIKLNIMVYRHPKLGGYLIEASHYSEDYQNILVRQEYKKDEIEEAFRLAIVKCAALIGKKMYNV